MVRSTAGVGVHALAYVVLEFEEVAEQAARNVDQLAADNYDPLSEKEFLGDDAG